jgi:hypothetical protein
LTLEYLVDKFRHCHALFVILGHEADTCAEEI